MHGFFLHQSYSASSLDNFGIDAMYMLCRPSIRPNDNQTTVMVYSQLSNPTNSTILATDPTGRATSCSTTPTSVSLVCGLRTLEYMAGASKSDSLGIFDFDFLCCIV